MGFVGTEPFGATKLPRLRLPCFIQFRPADYQAGPLASLVVMNFSFVPFSSSTILYSENSRSSYSPPRIHAQWLDDELTVAPFFLSHDATQHRQAPSPLELP